MTTVKPSGVIFDLDGTLVHSNIDFPGMRAALGMPEGDILKTIASWPHTERQQAETTIGAFEAQAARHMTLMPGVHQLLDTLWQQGTLTGLVTRNTLSTVALFLQKLPDHQDRIFPCLDRSFEPPKPDPAALLHIATHWNLPPHHITMVGDTTHDMLAAQEAGMRFVLVRQPHNGALCQSSGAPVIRACLTELLDFL